MEKLLRLLKEINPDIDYESERHLVGDGLFDSLEIMTIVVSIGEHFHIEINAEDVTAENFDSVENMMNLIKKYQEKGE